MRKDDFISITMKFKGSNEDYYVHDGDTLSTVLEEELGISATDFSVFVNGSPAKSDYAVADGDAIVIEEKAYKNA